MCPFEILHFVPLALILVVAFFARTVISRVSMSFVTSGLSIIGLVAGSHVHTAHAEPLTLLDPCVGYFIAIAVSFAVVIKELVKVKQLSK